MSSFDSLFTSYQEIDLALDILCNEGHSLPPDLGELLPIAVHPSQPGTLPVLGEMETCRTRRVFLTSSPNEDFFWAVNSISFVVDAGLEKRYVSSSFIFVIKMGLMGNLSIFQTVSSIRRQVNEKGMMFII